MYECYFVKFLLFSGNIKLFSPYLMDDETNPDTPLLVNEKIIFFRNINDATSFMREYYPNITYNKTTIYEFDARTFIENIKEEYHYGAVIDNLNIIFDYLNAIKINKYPFFSKKIIMEFADYVTFHKEIGVFFQKSPQLTPFKLINFLYWFLGEISCNSMIYSRHTRLNDIL